MWVIGLYTQLQERGGVTQYCGKALLGWYLRRLGFTENEKYAERKIH